MRQLLMPYFTVVVTILGSTQAVADLGDQSFKLLANDADAGNRFGSSVALSGTTAVIGASQDDENGLGSGSAYIFNTVTGQQLFKLLPDDGSTGARFGISIAVNGTIVIIGAIFDDDNGSASGSVYIYDSTTGQFITKFHPDDAAANDYFGGEVALSGNTAIIGAQRNDDNGEDSGSAYIFDLSNPQTPVQIVKLLATDGSAGDKLGTAVAISGNFAIVGAYNNGDNGTDSGSVYIFDTTTGQQLAKILPNDVTTGDHFGFSVGISGNTAIVGTVYDDDNGIDSGSAYLYDISDPKNPVQTIKLHPNDAEANDFFGYSVAISETSAIVGSFRDGDNGFDSGSAYLFETTTGFQIAKLLPDDGAEHDIFGASVTINETTALIAASGNDDNGNESGSVYLFEADFEALINNGSIPNGSGRTVSGTNVRGGWQVFQPFTVPLPGWTLNYIGVDGWNIQDPLGNGMFGTLMPDDGIGNPDESNPIAGAFFDLQPEDQPNTTSNWKYKSFFKVALAPGNYWMRWTDFNDPNNWSAVFFAPDGEGAFSRQTSSGDIFTGGPSALRIFGRELYPACGEADAGSCSVSNGTPGCNNAECCVIVCELEFSCCNDAWDQLCVDLAAEHCALPPCPWDLDGSGSVGTSDLLALFAQWGTDGPADFDGSGAVGTSDLLILFANWGSCP